MEGNNHTSHSAQIHQEDHQEGNIIRQLKSLTASLQRDLKIPNKKDLIDLLNRQLTDDDTDGQDSTATVIATTNDDAWRNATLQSSSSAISSTPTTESIKNMTQHSPSVIQSYESITVHNDDTSTEARNDTLQQITPTDIVLDDLTSRLDKLDAKNISDKPNQETPHIDGRTENEYKNAITKGIHTGILRQSRLTPQPQNFQDTDTAIINSTIDMIIAKTSNNTRKPSQILQSNKIENKQTSGFVYDESPSDTSHDDESDNAVFTATSDHAVITAPTSTHATKRRNYTLKDIENLLAGKPIDKAEKDTLLDSRPDTPSNIAQCQPLPPLRSLLQLNKTLSPNEDQTHEGNKQANEANQQIFGAKRKPRNHLTNVQSPKQTGKVHVSVNEQELRLQGTWKPHFNKFITRLRTEGEYKNFDNTQTWFSDDPFEDVMNLTEIQRQPQELTRTPSSTTSQDTRTSSFGAYQQSKFDRNEILIPTRYDNDTKDRATKKGLIKRVRDTIFKKQKQTELEEPNHAALSTISVQDDTFLQMHEETNSNDEKSDYETESDTDTDITMYHTQTDGQHDVKCNDGRASTDENYSDQWDHHRRVMNRITSTTEETNNMYEKAHETYIETAGNVMDKLTSLTDLLQLEPEDNSVTNMEPGHTLHKLQADFNVSNLINPIETTLESNEEPIKTRFFTMTTAQINSLKQKTHPTRLTKFNTAAENLTTVQNQLLNFSLQISTISDKARRKWQVQEKIDDVALAIIQLKKEESKLEELLQTLAAANYNNHQIPLPQKYGNINKLRINDFTNTQKYMPNGKTKLSHVWISTLERGKLIGKKSKTDEDDDCLSEDAWKDALSQHLLGEALDYHFHYNHLPLAQLLEKLYHRFEVIPSKYELHHEIDTFKKDHKDSLSCTIEKLRLILSKLYQDKQATEQEILIRRTIREKIINNNWLPRDIIRNILREEDDAKATCQSFCFETRAKDMDFWSKQTDGDLYNKQNELQGSLHAMATKPTESDPLKKPYGGRVNTHQTSRPPSRPATPPTTQLPNGRLRHGRDGQPGYSINPGGKGPRYNTTKAPPKQYNNRREQTRSNERTNYGAQRNDTHQHAEPMEQDEQPRNTSYTNNTNRPPHAHTFKPNNDYKPTSQNWTTTPDLCFYHSKYGNQAMKCTPPCKFVPRDSSYSYRQGQAYRNNNNQYQPDGGRNSKTYHTRNSGHDKIFRSETEFASDPAVVISSKFTIDEACRRHQCRYKTIHAHNNCPLYQQRGDFQQRR